MNRTSTATCRSCRRRSWVSSSAICSCTACVWRTTSASVVSLVWSVPRPPSISQLSGSTVVRISSDSSSNRIRRPSPDTSVRTRPPVTGSTTAPDRSTFGPTPPTAGRLKLPKPSPLAPKPAGPLPNPPPALQHRVHAGRRPAEVLDRDHQVRHRVGDRHQLAAHAVPVGHLQHVVTDDVPQVQRLQDQVQGAFQLHALHVNRDRRVDAGPDRFHVRRVHHDVDVRQRGQVAQHLFQGGVVEAAGSPGGSSRRRSSAPAGCSCRRCRWPRTGRCGGRSGRPSWSGT